MRKTYPLVPVSDSIDLRADSAFAAQEGGEPLEPLELSPADLANGQALIPGMGRRMLAYMIDYFLVFTVAFFLHMLILWGFSGYKTSALLANLYALFGIFLLVNGAYHIFSESNSVLRGTLGKLLCGLQVIDVDGQSLDRAQAKARFLWRLPSIALFMIPYLIVARGRYALALHDRKAFTVVTTRMPADRLASGLLAGREKTKLDKLYLVMAGCFLAYLLINMLPVLLRLV